MLGTRSFVQKEKLYDFEQIKEIYPGNDGFLRHFAEIFMKVTPSDCAEMIKATNENDWEKVSKYAHKIKSTVDSMNIVSLKTDIRTLEFDAKNKINTPNLIKLAIRIEKVIKDVSNAVKEDFNL